ncbi:hypothetical protein BGX34_009113 [Mortierella sp. NVP85]|nr:hypothetical protein BGX34_009113 [Mortierella sp. NVP85]
MSQATAPSGPTSRSQYADIDTPSNNTEKLSEKSPIHLAANILKLKDVGRKAQKRHFYSEILKFSRARTVVALSKAGTKCRPQADGSAPAPACIPDKTPSFKMVGEFNNYNPGHYVVHWRIKTLQNFSVPNGLHFVVNVSYDAEPDLSGTLDVILPADKLKSLANNRWYNLVLDEKLVIQPHQNVARIQAILCNNENIDRHEYCGFLIDYVEIRPIALAPEKNPGVTDIYVSRPATPRFTIDTAKAWPKVSQDPSFNPSSAPITRLATSKNSRYIASLAQSQDFAYISVWDMGAVKNMMHPPKNLGKLYKNCATTVIRHPNVGNLSLGLALSANADQVVVYQEPMIGDWADGSKVEKASFPFRLYNNPLVPQTSFVVNIDSASSSSVYEKNEASVDEKPNRRKHVGQSTSTPEAPSETIELELVPWEHELLKVFIGFAAFLPESKKGDWEKDDINTTLAGSTDADDGDAGENKDAKEKVRVPANTMFVTCNGIYLDVFRISPEKKWKRIHTITLTDLLPTLSRRITCKMMMESIGTNVFMWLEDGGRSCTIWDLFKGSNITHISSVEGGRFKGSSFRGHCKMAISPHESIVALASADGSLTTYFANTGMAIDDRKFPGYKIEYIAFHAQDDQLFVILRSSVTYELSARVLDTLQLKSEVAASLVPIPVIGSTILAFFNLKGFWNRSVVCEPDGSKINCYIAYQPSSSKKLNKQGKTVIKADPDDDVYESSLNGHTQYRLMTAFHNELLPDGDGVSYWVLRVEVFEENLRTKTQRIIFSFVPEPWMRITTSDVVHPENLQSIFFVPCGTRFAVVGMQTLQIWNLPTSDNAKCTLQFIWSQPKDDKELMSGGTAYKSPRVRDYYMDISSASIYMDIETGSTTAEIKMNDKSKKRIVPLPGPRTLGARFAILFCFRSIHLLAAAYAFSHQESNRATREWTFTFEEHAEAIARFAREHINRMMSSGVYAPQSKAPRTNSKQPPRPKAKQRQVASGANNDAPPAALETMEPHTIISAPISEDHFHIHDLGDRSDSDSSSDDEDGSRSKEGKPAPTPIVRPKVVTLLTLLLDEPYLQQTNHIFVGGLLNTANGDWIPRDNVALNPIKRVIEARNAPLLEAFIDYCIKNAKKYHPSYMMPAVQCLNLLSVRYPNILADMFKRAAYVPVHNHAYVASHAVVANPQRLQWLKSRLMFWNYGKFEKSNNINDYSRPVFSLRSQLPFRASSFLNILNIETSVRDTREDDFPAKPEVDEDKKNMPTRYSHKIYVAPFPKLSMYGPYRPFRPWLKDSYWSGGPSSNSAFIEIAGQEFFGSPAMVATLEFKW